MQRWFGGSIALALVASAAWLVPPVSAGETSPTIDITEVTVAPPDPVALDDVAVTVAGTGVCTEPGLLVQLTLHPILDDGDVLTQGLPVAFGFSDPSGDGDWSGVLDLAGALPGIYNVEARCGPEVDAVWEAFRVAPPADFAMTVEPRERVGGVAGAIEVRGAGCLFPIVEVALEPADAGLLTLVADVMIDTPPDGTWAVEVPYSAAAAGEYQVLARCGTSPGIGRHVYYETQPFTLIAPDIPEPPPPPPQPEPPDFTG